LLLADCSFATDDKGGERRVHHALDSTRVKFVASLLMFWQAKPMSGQSPQAGGIYLPIGIFAGLLMGAATGQPTAGLLLGTAGGTAAATWFWFKDRKANSRRRKP
jgi:membrane associated rhomboid family serine protease